MAELTHRRRTGVLAICCMSLLLVSLDTTILNVALPAIRREFDASVSGLQWTIDAYVLVLASLLMLSGSTADRIGRRRVFQTGLVLFTAGSVLCSLAPGLGRLVAARGPRPPLLAAGAAMTLGGGLSAVGGTGSPGSPDALLLASFVLFGVGMGLLNAPVTNTAVSGMPVSQAGVAAGIASTGRQVGQVLGVAVVGSVIAAGTGGEAAAGAGFTGAARTAWWIITGCGAAVLVLGAATTGAWARGTAERAAALIGTEGTVARPGGSTGARTG